ncbi:uncharacterized protein BP01DRAFT_100044 [Aspergillus saccharolyticus JOP 1030-1]|uniref:Uncharacterized protein n=1 Tax=Aspergillus saccharolyticus JOP 1030-1 TaxID=1450539 RepID=A0A318ZAN7_9EURO|nr:hypothetical protein BP01DRAFT_100044 [Aspergillus saccharolyticus JOP 1030-1]PYH43517.1 hypothetical protein BP01DRAFT_100044 [Aspergillus saccharolyticus JOP 1030-1]
MASKIFTPRIKRVGFADPLTSSPGQSKPKISPSGDVTHKKSNDDIKESAGYKDMPSSVSELLYALHEKTVDDILSDEASQHSSRFDDYSQIPRTSDTPDYGRSPDRSQGTQQRLQAEFQLSSPDWALGKRIIPHILSDFELADDTTSESGSEMSSELEFESATESRSQPKSTTTLESIMLPPDSPQPNALLTDIESIDLSGSPAPQSPPYSTARDYRRSQDSDDETSDFEFDSDCEEDYHRFPLVSRPLVRDLGFALCATDFMQKGVYPVNRAEKRTFVDYASQKASEISMTEEEFARMMNALRGVYLLQWGEKTGKAPKVPPEAGQNAMTGDGKDQLWVNSGEHSAVKSQTQPAALGFESVESLPHADSVDEQDGDVVLESRLNERKFKAMKHSVSKSSGRLNPVSIGEPEKGCMTLPDESKLGSPDWRTTAAAIDVSLPKTPSCGSGSPRMERKPVGQKGKPSGGGVEEKATKAEAALDHAATSGKKRKQDDDIIIIPKRHPENTASVDKSKRRKKAHRSSGNHNSSNRSSTLPVQLNKNAQPDIKYLEKAAKDITTNTTERSNALQSQQRSDIESFGTERLNRLSIEPIRDIRPDTTQQSEKSTNTFTSLHAKNASNSASIERPTAPQPVQISRYSNSRQYSGNRGAGSKNAVESEKMESIQESGKVKKAGQSRKRRTTRGTADVTELTGPGKGDKTNKATSSQPHTLVKLDIATRPGTGKTGSDCQAQMQHRAQLKIKQAKSRHANPNWSPRTPTKAKARPAEKEPSGFPTPMIRKGEPPALRYGPYTSRR